MTHIVIQTSSLAKAFGSRSILTAIDLEVAEGSTFALLGPNGAGKTTLVRILSTLINPTSGSVTVAGFDLRTQADQIRSAISLTGQYAAVDELLTARENMRLMTRLRHLDRSTSKRQIDALLERLDLTKDADRPVKTFSGGMRRKLDLALSLIGSPRIIFLDEPTTGLDPRSRVTLWEMIDELTASGVTIFLTTQYLEEADRLADRVSVIDGGRIVAEGTPADLKRRIGGERIELHFTTLVALDAARAAIGSPSVQIDPDTCSIRIPTDGTAHDVARILETMRERSLGDVRIDMLKPTLDDVFFALTGGAQTATRKAA